MTNENTVCVTDGHNYQPLTQDQLYCTKCGYFIVPPKTEPIEKRLSDKSWSVIQKALSRYAQVPSTPQEELRTVHLLLEAIQEGKVQ